MGDEPYVGFVDTHAERNRRHHDDALFPLESGLMPGACRCLHAGVIGQCIDTVSNQPRSGFVHFSARQAIHDTSLTGMLVADETHQLRARVGLVDDGIANVRTIEARDEDTRVVERQARSDFGARLRIGGGSQRDPRHAWKPFVQHGQLKILGPEIVTPLGDAMRFIDRKQSNLDLLKQSETAWCGQPLGRHIQQIELACQQNALYGPRGAGIQGRVQVGGAHTQQFQRRNLILHQRDERRDHDPGPSTQKRRNLIAQRFSTAGRHQYERITARCKMTDDFFLRPAETRVTERLTQQRQRTSTHRRICSISSSSARAANSRIFASLSVRPVSIVIVDSAGPATETQEWPAASP